MTLQRLTQLEIQRLGQRLSVADLVADDDEFANAAKAIIGFDDLDPQDLAAVIEEAFLCAEHRFENLDYARDQARTPEVLLRRVIDKRRSDGT